MTSPHYPQPPYVAPAKGSSSVAPLLLSGLALLSCCFPAGLIGLLLGLKARKDAKMRGEATPLTATLAAGVGALSLVVSAGMIAFGVMTYVDQADTKALTDVVEDRRSGATLEQDVACLLAQAEIKKDSAVQSVECLAPLQTEKERAVLEGVRVKRADGSKVVKACFAKTKRWFVLELREAGDCSTRTPQVALKGLAASNSPEGLERAEELYREDEIVFQNALREVRFEQALAKVAAAVDTARKVASTCPDLAEAAQKRSELVYVERARLVDFDRKRSDAEKRWDFMTKRELRQLLDEGGTQADREKTLDGVAQQPLMVVFVPNGDEEPVWPRASEGDVFETGVYDGTLYLVDSTNAAVLCGKPFHFENGDTISVRRNRLGLTPQSRVEDKLAADFEERFEDAAVARVKELTGGKLELGISLLE